MRGGVTELQLLQNYSVTGGVTVVTLVTCNYSSLLWCVSQSTDGKFAEIG